MFLGLIVVTALSAGLSLPAPWAHGNSAAAVTPASDAVIVSIFPTGGASASEGQDLAVTISLTNTSSDVTPAGEIVVTTGSSVLGDAAQIDEWLAKSDDEQQPGRWLGIVDAPALPPGASIDLTATLPLNNALYGDSWGPRGLAADLEINARTAGSGRGVLVWTTPVIAERAALVTLLPVVSTASGSGLLTADELTVLTSPQGILTTQLGIATDRNVTLAVDPRVLASIGALGSEAPASALSWLDRLLALTNESFALAYADADVALQAQAGASALLTAAFSDQALLTPQATSSATPSATPAATPAPTGTPATSSLPALGTLATTLVPAVANVPWIPSLANVSWPAENTVIAADMSVLAPTTSTVTILSSRNIASGANSPSVVTVGDNTAFVTNDALTRALQNATAASSDAQWSRSFSLASAYLATTALNPSAEGGAIATLDRRSGSSSSLTRAAQTLDRLSGLAWVEPGTLGTVSALTGGAARVATNIVDLPESEERVQVAKAILSRHGAVADFSTVLESPALLTDATTRHELALFSVAWTADDAWPGAVSRYQQSTSTILNSIRLVPSSEIQMVGGQVNIPVTIENTLAFPATVLVRATPSNARLRVDSDATATIQGEAQAKALIPVVARVGNGSVLLTVSLYSSSGVPIGTPASLPVTVRADWESWGLGVLGALFAALLITGVIRTVRKRRDEKIVTSSE